MRFGPAGPFEVSVLGIVPGLEPSDPLLPLYEHHSPNPTIKSRWILSEPQKRFAIRVYNRSDRIVGFVAYVDGAPLGTAAFCLPDSFVDFEGASAGDGSLKTLEFHKYQHIAAEEGQVDVFDGFDEHGIITVQAFEAIVDYSASEAEWKHAPVAAPLLVDKGAEVSHQALQTQPRPQEMQQQMVEGSPISSSSSASSSPLILAAPLNTPIFPEFNSNPELQLSWKESKLGLATYAGFDKKMDGQAKGLCPLALHCPVDAKGIAVPLCEARIFYKHLAWFFMSEMIPSNQDWHSHFRSIFELRGLELPADAEVTEPRVPNELILKSQPKVPLIGKAVWNRLSPSYLCPVSSMALSQHVRQMSRCVGEGNLKLLTLAAPLLECMSTMLFGKPDHSKILAQFVLEEIGKHPRYYASLIGWDKMADLSAAGMDHGDEDDYLTLHALSCALGLNFIVLLPVQMWSPAQVQGGAIQILHATAFDIASLTCPWSAFASKSFVLAYRSSGIFSPLDYVLSADEVRSIEKEKEKRKKLQKEKLVKNKKIKTEFEPEFSLQLDSDGEGFVS